MNFDAMNLQFYENTDMKAHRRSEDGASNEHVMQMLGNNWNEENIDIEELLSTEGAGLRQLNPHQSQAQPNYPRPDALDLSPPNTKRNLPMMNPAAQRQVNAHHHQRPIHQVPDISSSPSNSPYMPPASAAFSYNSRMNMQERAVPMVSNSPMNSTFAQYRPASTCPPTPCSPYQVERKYNPNAEGMYPRSRKRSSTSSSLDKESDSYKAKRERNNVAVRKSREKKKMREVETENKVKELQEENSKLKEKQEALKSDFKTMSDIISSIGTSLPLDVKKYLEANLAKLSTQVFQQQ